MTTEQLQGIADRTLRQVALRYGSTTNRDFRVIELVLEQVGSAPDSAGEAGGSAHRSEAKTSNDQITRLTNTSNPSPSSEMVELQQAKLHHITQMGALMNDPSAENVKAAGQTLDAVITAALAQRDTVAVSETVDATGQKLPRIEKNWLLWSPMKGVISCVPLQPEHHALITAALSQRETPPVSHCTECGDRPALPNEIVCQTCLKPEHVCGLAGYNGMIDPPCPACAALSQGRASQEEQ